MHRPGAATTSAAARPVLGDIVEHVYEATTPQQEDITAAATTTSTTNDVTTAHASAAPSLDVAGPVRVKELHATLKPIQAVVGQAFPPVRPHTSYRVPTTTSATTTLSCTRGEGQAACACPATMQHTDNNTNKSDTPLTRDETSMTTSAAVPSYHLHTNNDTNATRRDSDTQPSATSTPSVLLPLPLHRGMQVSAHVQPDMPSLEDSADPATTLRFTRPSYAQSTHETTTHTSTTNSNVVQPVSHSAGTSTSAETMPELLGRLPVGGIAMRTTTTATGDSDFAVAAESVAVPCQWSPTDFVHMFRGYYAVPVREDVLIQQQQQQQERGGGMLYGYDIPLDLQAWSQTHNNNTNTSSSSSSERAAITTSSAAVSSQPHQATTTTTAVVPTGEAYLRLLRRGLCSTVTRHQTLAMQALLLHLHYEGAVLRERCLRGSSSSGAFTSLSEGETNSSGDDDSGVSLLQTLLTHMTQATQVMPCRLAARCLLALLNSTDTRCTQDEPTHHATVHSTSPSPSTTTTTSHSLTTTSNNYSKTISLVMQPAEILQHALREIAFPLTDPTETHTTRRPNEESKGTQTNTTSEEVDGEDGTCTGPQLPSTQEEVERLLSSGDDADVALAAEALGLTEKLLRVMPLLLLLQPAEDAAGHEVHADTHTATTTSSSNPLTSAGHVAEEEEKDKRDACCDKANSEPTDTYHHSHRYATETLFLQLLRCGGLGLSEQTSCMRVAHNTLFAQWAEQQLSAVVLGERDLASLLPLLCVLHDIAHCPKAFTALLTTMSFDANTAANALLTGSNKNKKKVVGSGNRRSGEEGKEGDEVTMSHGTARETWLLFALYVCSMDVTRHTNTTNTNSSSNNTDNTSGQKKDNSEVATTAAVVMSLLLLRELIRHGIGLTLFLRDTCSTILETGMTMGAAMLLEMWLVLLEQQQQASSEEESERNNSTTTTTATVTSSPLSVRPEQPIFDEAARIAWHLYHRSLTNKVKTTNTTAVIVDANTKEKDMPGRAHVTKTEEEKSTSTSQSAHNMPALLREVAAVTNGHFSATYLTLRATHHEHKAPNTHTDCNNNINEEDSHAVSPSSSSLLSFFGSVAETRRQVLALLTNLVANEEAYTAAYEAQSVVMTALACTTPHSDITATNNKITSGHDTKAPMQVSPNMTCNQTAQRTHEQRNEVDCVHEACTMARRYANARVACAIHTAWASLLPDTEPLLLLHRYGNAGLTAFVQHCHGTQSKSAVRHVLHRLQPEELSTVLELIDLVQHTPQSTQTTTTEDDERVVEKELMDMAALLVLQGMCVTGHCLDGAPRALRCLLPHTHTTTHTTTTSLTPISHSSQTALSTSLSSPVSQASLVACLCAGLERAAGLRVAADITTHGTNNNSGNGGRDGGEGERGDARTTLIGGGAEGRPWLLYPLYYNNTDSESDEEAEEEDETLGNVDKVVWAQWLIGLARLPSWFTQHVLQCDMLLSHALLWTLAHRGSLFAPGKQRTITTQAHTDGCNTTTTTSEDASEGCEMTGADMRALCALLAELALLLVPAEVVVAEGDDSSMNTVEQKSLTTTTTTALDMQSAASLPATQQHAPHITQPRCRFSPSASATLGIPLQAYAHPQSEAPMPAVLHWVLALVAAYAQPTTTLTALQLLLNTPLCATTTTNNTPIAAEASKGSESARCHTDGEGHITSDDDAKKKIERHDGVDCVKDNNYDNDTVVCHSLSRLQAQLRAALTWWSSAVQPPLPHSVSATGHNTTCTTQSNTFPTSSSSSVMGVRRSLTELVALLQLVGPYLTHHPYSISNTHDAAYTHSDDDYEGDDVVSDTEARVCETDVHHGTTPTTAANAAYGHRKEEECEDDIRLWCVATVTEGLMRRYLYTHAKPHTDTTTSMSDTCKAEAGVTLSAMEQTVLRETLRQLHWQPAVLWPYVA